jgi:hypothetical protein
MHYTEQQQQKAIFANNNLYGFPFASYACSSGHFQKKAKRDHQSFA